METDQSAGLPLSLLSGRVGTISEIGAGVSFNQSFADRVEGRYVTLSLPGSSRYLTLCEVEVYGYRAPTGENKGNYITALWEIKSEFY